MMEGRPIKFRILELLDRNGPMWNHDIGAVVSAEYGMADRYGRDCINYDLIEMEAAGFIRAVEMVDDTEEKFRKGYFLTQYRMTSLGKSQFDYLVDKSGERCHERMG